MSKQDDKIREVVKEELDVRINRGLRWFHIKCMSSTTAILLVASTAGSFLVKYWDALSAGIAAFLEAMKK